MILILGGPGTAIFGQFIGFDIGTLGVALAFGLSLLCAAYLFGHISGCHINPAVTIGDVGAPAHARAGRCPAYLVGQILGALVGGVVIWAIVETGDNGGGRQARPQGALQRRVERLRLALAGQVRARRRDHRRGPVHRALRARDRRHHADVDDRPASPAIPIGLMLTLVHLISIPIDNTSVNPVRSLADRGLRRQLGDRTALGVHRLPDHRWPRSPPGSGCS